jgi:hypothetical protein
MRGVQDDGGEAVFGSQILEVAIGLVLAFFLLATAASAVVEGVSALLKKRATDLENSLNDMLGAPAKAPGRVPQEVTATKLFQMIVPAKKKPSYLSAKAFANSIGEIIAEARSASQTGQDLYDKLPTNLKEWLEPVVKEVGADATAIKARLESWFDERMARLEGTYKRWAQLLLFFIGLALVIGTNASAYRMAAVLYSDPAVRSAVTQSATSTATTGVSSSPQTIQNNIKSVADAVGSLDSLGLPVGWHNWNQPGSTWGVIAGWFVTAALLMLGAPFWFGLLSKLVSLRSTGQRPPKASDDPTSATATLRQAPAAPALRAAAVGPTDWMNDLMVAF